MVKEGALRKKCVRDHEMGPVLGGMKRAADVYKSMVVLKDFPKNHLVHCLGWCHIMAPDGSIFCTKA